MEVLSENPPAFGADQRTFYKSHIGCQRGLPVLQSFLQVEAVDAPIGEEFHDLGGVTSDASRACNGFKVCPFFKASIGLIIDHDKGEVAQH